MAYQTLGDLLNADAMQQAQIGAIGQESQLRNLQMQTAQQDFNDKAQLRNLMQTLPANGDLSSIMPQLRQLGPQGIDAAVKMAQSSATMEQIDRQNAIRKQISAATQGGGMGVTDGSASGQGAGGMNGYRQKMAMVYMQNGDPDTAMKYMPKVKDWKEVQTANGVQYAPLFEDGGFGSPVPMQVAKALHFADTGGRAGVGVDQYTGAPVTAGFAKTLDPGQLLTANTTMRGQNMADARSRETTVQGKTPAGYRATQDGNLQAIPGGPADLKMQGAFNQDTAMLSGSTNSMDRLATAANELLNHPGLKGIYGMRGVVPNIPGTEAADAAALLNTLKSQVGFGVLQDMRNNSKTGGALGAVSDAENKMLQSNLAALEKAQSVEQATKSLQKIISYTDDAKSRLSSAYNLKHGNQSYGQNAQQPTQPKAPQMTIPNADAIAAEIKRRGM